MATVDAGLELTSDVADGGVAHILDTKLEFTSGTLLSLRNNGVEKFFVDFGGNVDLTGTLDVTGAVTLDSGLTVASTSEDAITVEAGGTTNRFLKGRIDNWDTADGFAFLGTGVGTPLMDLVWYDDSAGTESSIVQFSSNQSAAFQAAISSVGAATLDTGANGSSFGGTLGVTGRLTAKESLKIRSDDTADTGFLGGENDWTGSGTGRDFAVATYQSNMRFYTNNNVTERMRLDSGGNLGVGAHIAVGGVAAPVASTSVLTKAATTALSSVRLPHGTAPSSPVNGDMWTTTAGLFVRINGSTVGPLS